MSSDDNMKDEIEGGLLGLPETETELDVSESNFCYRKSGGIFVYLFSFAFHHSEC